MNLAVCVPKDVSCELLLYKKGESEPDQVIEMPAEEGIGEVRFLALEDLEETQYEYNYRIDGTVCLDPYVREIAGHKNVRYRLGIQPASDKRKISAERI